ncbi:DUF2382 domain-containing protein [Marinactinospora thermotolerans]|uniref:Conserved domain-containing protein n=1 Tax=Marinactinospora thermotolerans DSM 45154 TaxID=1122192 RepID=A0A1T4NKN6_9ACTN|nr:PRC and DUF2382 domain-containing protein [Marinactinospora thermotolerans]SJZ79762.1 conserved domain-containing protein [Marinactinospora thermotolerans DSM 45154]
MAPQKAAQEFVGHKLLDREGNNVGRIEQIYFDDRTDKPTWVSVQTGMLGRRHSLVPLQGARVNEGDLMVPFDKERIKDAPDLDVDRHLSVEEENRLYRHYGVQVPGPRRGMQDQGDAQGRHAAGAAEETGMAGRATGEHGTDTRAANARAMNAEAADARTAEADTRSGRGRADAMADEDITMVRSEEQAHVGVESRESGRAHVRKSVDTEHFEQDVPVSHEEIHVERVPLTDEDRATAGNAQIGEEDEEIILHAERAVVAKETKPVEKVRISKEKVTDVQHVEGELRKEHVEVDREADHLTEDDYRGRRRPPAG